VRYWTTAELAALRHLAPLLGCRGLAEALGRSERSVERQAARQGISLRRKESGGAAGDELSPAALKRIRELAVATLCPACGKRLAGVKASGLCWSCHRDGLIALHEEKVERLESQRRLMAARQKLQRRRAAAAADES